MPSEMSRRSSTAAAAFAIALVFYWLGTTRGTTRPDYLADPVMIGEQWQIFALPPCSTDFVNLVAVGLSFKLAYEHASDLVPPSEDVRAHPLPFKEGRRICP